MKCTLLGKNIKKLLIIKVSFILTILGVFGTGINVYADNVLPSNASEISREISTLESDSQTSKIIADKNEIKSLDQESPPDTKISDEITDNSVTKNTSVKKNQEMTIFKEMVITDEVEKDSHFTSPSTRITRSHIEKQNAQTTEEILKYQPSLQIRQRYIGDPNGVLGIRGGDMFSTARNMVYADGLPLHNQMQSTFNGAPRWSLVGPNEIDVVDVVYGPFSAEYSSNSIGGVVNMKTRMPRKEEMYVESSVFLQAYNNLGAKQTLIGDRQYISYGNRFKDALSVFVAYNRLESQGQPQSYLLDNTGLNTPSGTGDRNVVSGGILTSDTRGTPSMIYGNSGAEKVVTDLMKFKLGYDITPGLQAIFTAAYEDRNRSNTPKNYLKKSSGAAFYGNGTLPNAMNGVGGDAFDVLNAGFGPIEEDRQTLQLGLNLRGELTPNWFIDTTTSHFDVLKDRKFTALLSPNDPTNQNKSTVQDFKQFTWFNHDLKLSNKALFGNEKLGFLGGYHFDQYKLGFRQYDSPNYSGHSLGTMNTSKSNDGMTTTHAFYAQSSYHFLPEWDLTAGVRQEFWAAENGVVGGIVVKDRYLAPTTPKASIGYGEGPWKFRYSFGQTHRFPTIAELYQTLSTPTNITTANAAIRPENGIHHNFMIEHGLRNGYIRMNIFRDDIKDAIQSVRTVSGILTQAGLQNIGQTATTGVELIYDQRRILRSKFDFMLNFTWMNAEVTKGGLNNFTEANGTLNPYNLTGKQIIRLPHYRLNFFTTYNATSFWDVSMGGRYTSDSFNDIDNRDTVHNVYGSQSDFFFLDVKTNYRHQFSNGIKSRYSFGINNLNNTQAYVFHPYPQRTFFAEAAFSF